MTVLKELEWRGFVHQRTHEEELEEALESPISLYCGFDPTSDTLHIGSLVPIMGLAHFCRAGHKPYALVGGATGMIGDPSGKSEERNLLTPEQIQHNLEGIGSQLQRILSNALTLHSEEVVSGSTDIPIVNNADWMREWSFIDFLRDVGKHFRVNQMVKKDSVASRMENEVGISFTEFSYMLIQSYDFLHLHRVHGCTLQIGGSDQWGNITAGTELIRRVEGQPSFGLTFPLLSKANGEKFGKTASGTKVWLDADKTSPYEFFQFWRNCDDDDVVRFLKMFTFLSESEIQDLEDPVASHRNRGEVQAKLAWEVTALVHGPEEADKSAKAAKMLFGEKIEDLSDRDLNAMFQDVPSSVVDRARLEGGVSLVELLHETGMQPSKGKARKVVAQGGAYVNNVRVSDIDYRVTSEDLASESFAVLRTGKKNWHVLEVQGKSLCPASLDSSNTSTKGP